jgi:hypothetical protein
VVLEYCRKANCVSSRQDDRQIVHFGAGSRNGTFTVVLHVLQDRAVVLCHAIAGFRVPEANRTAMAEFITRANYGIMLGNLEMDFSDGEVRYKTSIDLQDGVLTTKMVEVLCAASVTTIDRYLPGMLAVLGGETPPKQAVDEVEHGSRSDSPGIAAVRRRATPWPFN